MVMWVSSNRVPCTTLSPLQLSSGSPPTENSAKRRSIHSNLDEAASARMGLGCSSRSSPPGAPLGRTTQGGAWSRVAEAAHELASIAPVWAARTTLVWVELVPANVLQASGAVRNQRISALGGNAGEDGA